MKAWEEGDLIHIYAIKYEEMSILGLSEQKGYLYKWSIDLKKGKVVYDSAVDKEKIACEFPTINQKLIGRKTRYTYVSNTLEVGSAPLMNSVSKFDLDTHTRLSTIQFGDDCYGGEFFFAPRVDAKSEDDGYLMSFVHDEKNNISYFYIVDALQFKLCAKVKLLERVPYGFHGKWVNRQQIESQNKKN